MPNHPSWRDPLDPNTIYCSYGHPRAIAMRRNAVESKIAQEGEHEAITFPQARYVCPICGMGEVYIRDPLEYREAAEAERRGEVLLRWEAA